MNQLLINLLDIVLASGYCHFVHSLTWAGDLPEIIINPPFFSFSFLFFSFQYNFILKRSMVPISSSCHPVWISYTILVGWSIMPHWPVGTSGNIRGKMKGCFQIKPGQPRGMALTSFFFPFPNSLNKWSLLKNWHKTISERGSKCYFQNESECCFIGVSKHRELNMKARGRRLSAFIVSRCLDTPMKHEARVLEITSHAWPRLLKKSYECCAA